MGNVEAKIMGKAEAAKVKGIKTNEEEKQVLDQILEKVDTEALEQAQVFRIIDAGLTKEIREMMQGHYSQEYIYNYPRKSETGRKTWKECDLMRGGCPYKGKVEHIHIVGVGIQGAMAAMRSYGEMDAEVVEKPRVVEEGGVNYWAACATAVDHHTGNKLTRWYHEPLLYSTRQGSREKDAGDGIAQSKALRNVVLPLMPSDLMNEWLERYRSGGKPFDRQTATDMGYGKTNKKPKKEQDAAPAKAGPITEKAREQFVELVERTAAALDVDVPDLGKFAEDRSVYETQGKVTVAMVRALDDESKLELLREEFVTWLEKQEPGKEIGFDALAAEEEAQPSLVC